MKAPIFTPLQKLLGVVGGMLALPAILLLSNQAAARFEDDRRAVELQALTAAEKIIQLTDLQLAAETREVEVLAASSMITSPDLLAAAARARMNARIAGDWAFVALVDGRSGRLLFATSPQRDLTTEAPPPLGPDRALSRAGPGCPCVLLTETVAGPQRRRLVVGVKLTTFQSILMANAPRTGISAIVDRQGLFVARSIAFDQRAGTPATAYVRRAVARGGRGVYEARTYEGLANYTGYVTSPQTGWSAHISVERNLLDAPRTRARLASVAGAILALFVGGALLSMLIVDMIAQRRRDRAAANQQKLEALGQLTGGIAHDFNNLLQAMQGSFELIKRRTRDETRVQELADGGLLAIERGARLTSQLLAFARSRQLALEPIRLSQLVLGMREMLLRALGPALELRFEVDPDETPVMSDRTQLELAILNLAINARDAMSGAGVITIRTRKREIIARDDDLPRGTYMQLTVADQGPGMTPEVRAKAFEPFFTTKDVGRGTGLGLSQVYGVARQAGGTARIDSEPGQGAAISIFMPSAGGTPELTAVAPPAQSGSRRFSVLLVDDDPVVRAALADTLTGLGHQCEAIGEAEEALRRLEAKLPDVLVTDFAMPRINGLELARRARSRWPHLPIVFLTGFVQSDDSVAAMGELGHVLRKPVSAAQLQAELGAVAPPRPLAAAHS
jgi:signal transduction histidine kinase